MKLITTRKTATMGLRPGVKLSDVDWMWPWTGEKPYYILCDYHERAPSIDSAFAKCKDCGHAWRETEETRTYSPPFEMDTAINATVPDKRCVTCVSVAMRNKAGPVEEKPLHHLNVCHCCGAFICYPHTYWHGSEDDQTICTTCRRDYAKAGVLGKGECRYGKDRSA